MKIYRLYTLLVILLSAGMLQGCSDVEERLEHLQKADSGLLKIECVIPGMNPWTVTTRADNKDDNEKRITSLQLFIFDNNGNPLLVEEETVETEQWYQTGTSNSFLIDKGLFSKEQPHDKAKICFLANVEDNNLSNIADYQSLQNYLVRFGGYTLPTSGLPMYGEQVWDLTADDNENQQGEVVPIRLQALVARIDVILGLDSDEPNGPSAPNFTLVSYDICNLPKGVKIVLPGDETITDNEEDYNSFRNLEPPSHGALEDKSEPLKFHFYMGEHKALAEAQDGFTYPNNIDENAKQRFKPKFAKENASYLVLRGFYSDHQGVKHSVAYTIYLGANHTNDFNILRNCQYKNNITVRGITNRNAATGISIDHRVNVTNDKFLVSIERETKLDCHIEIRPMDIQMANKNGKVVVSIVDPDNTNWFRMEKRSTEGTGYCSKGSHAGKRKYFTTDLVTNTLAGNTSVEVTSNTDNRIWLYFDENLNASINGMREGQIKLEYYDNTNDETASKTEIYTFKQHDLYPVTYNGRTYYIEYIEEYLYNFDPKDNFGDTTDGMKWGLEGQEVSSVKEAITLEGSWLSDFLNKYVIPEVSPYYDFDDNFDGVNYTTKVITKAEKFVLSLENAPTSAVEYCYNKNKRNAQGKVVALKWYMPAIGEIEDIAQGAYTSFSTFQDKYYWSSQPAYENYLYTCNTWTTSGKGTFRKDNVKNARATKIKYENNQYNLVTSGVQGAAIKKQIKWNMFTGASTKDIATGQTIILDEGNKSRSEINRVRSIRQNFGDIIIRK